MQWSRTAVKRTHLTRRLPPPRRPPPHHPLPQRPSTPCTLPAAPGTAPAARKYVRVMSFRHASSDQASPCARNAHTAIGLRLCVAAPALQANHSSNKPRLVCFCALVVRRLFLCRQCLPLRAQRLCNVAHAEARVGRLDALQAHAGGGARQRRSMRGEGRRRVGGGSLHCLFVELQSGTNGGDAGWQRQFRRDTDMTSPTQQKPGQALRVRGQAEAPRCRGKGEAVSSHCRTAHRSARQRSPTERPHPPTHPAVVLGEVEEG